MPHEYAHHYIILFTRPPGGLLREKQPVYLGAKAPGLFRVLGTQESQLAFNCSCGPQCGQYRQYITYITLCTHSSVGQGPWSRGSPCCMGRQGLGTVMQHSTAARHLCTTSHTTHRSLQTFTTANYYCKSGPEKALDAPQKYDDSNTKAEPCRLTRAQDRA